MGGATQENRSFWFWTVTVLNQIRFQIWKLTVVRFWNSQEILSEDATHPYNTHTLSYPPPPAVSDDNIHEEGEGLEGDSPNLIDLDPLNPEAYAFSVDL